MIRKKYDDMLDYEWTGSPSHPKMPLSSRAKIFMPFAALKGYEELLAQVRLQAEAETAGGSQSPGGQPEGLD